MKSKNGIINSSYSFLQLALTVVFTVALLLSNIIVNKQISLPLGQVTVGSVILFPLTYVLSDVFSEVYGYRWSRVTCYIAFAMNIFMVLVCELTLAWPYPESFTNQAAFQAVLGSTPRITAASLIAFVAGDFVNDRVFERMKRLHPDISRFAWRAIASSCVGELSDCVVFLPLAFIGTLPARTLVGIGLAQVSAKILIEAILLPLTIFVAKIVRKDEMHRQIADI